MADEVEVNEDVKHDDLFEAVDYVPVEENEDIPITPEIFESKQDEVPVVTSEEPKKAEEVKPEEVKDEFADWDKQKAVDAYQNLQRKITDRDKEAKTAIKETQVEREARIRLEAQLEMLTQKPEEVKPEITMPVAPVKPTNFDKYNKHDPDTPSGQYWESLTEYNSQMVAYQNQIIQGLAEAENVRQEATKKTAEETAFRNEMVKQFEDQLGLTPQDALKRVEFLQSKAQDVTNLNAYYEAVHGNPEGQSKAQQKIDTMTKKNALGEIPLPAGTTPGHADPEKTADDGFNEELMTKRIDRNI